MCGAFVFWLIFVPFYVLLFIPTLVHQVFVRAFKHMCDTEIDLTQGQK